MGERTGSDGDGDFWRTRVPDRRLARWVSFYLAYRRTSGVPQRRSLAALNSVVLVIDLDTPIRRPVEGSPLALVSPVAGLSNRPMVYEVEGREQGVVVELTPLGARALFRMPLRELSNTSAGFFDLFGHRARRLAEELSEARDWDLRFRILDHRLAEWITDGPGLARPFDASWRSLTTTTANLTVHDLTRHTGLSRQHLSTRFHREIGLPPKTVGRIARCHRAIRLITGRAPPPLPAVAHLCGYADQSHLNRDFRLLVGCAPTALLRPEAAHLDLFLGSLISLRPVPRTGTRLESGLPLSGALEAPGQDC
ncbi:helix-turn-helix domain-containing protein [Actinosynnema sp. NPDC020468]|uniref:helix-turn-helix domain-containing protein n=1 Tax=Actinosynnema sp. NPDC020468 TaxID=3154488 RepID=UPI0034111753